MYDKGNPGGQNIRCPTLDVRLTPTFITLSRITTTWRTSPFFLQGNPHDHVPNLFEKVWSLTDDVRFQDLSEYIIVEDKFGDPVHPGLPLGPFYQALFGTRCPEYIVTCAAACFAVAKEVIRARPRSFYERALSLVCSDPLGPYTIERLWQFIFHPQPETEAVATAVDAPFFSNFRYLWHSLYQFNDRPVVVFDLGLAPHQRDWCLSQPGLGLHRLWPWHPRLNHLLKAHFWQTWIKPIYLYQAPYDRVLWIDSDCVLLDDVSPAFEILKERPLLIKDPSRGPRTTTRSFIIRSPYRLGCPKSPTALTLVFSASPSRATENF